jgi:hypothetical protein
VHKVRELVLVLEVKDLWKSHLNNLCNLVQRGELYLRRNLYHKLLINIPKEDNLLVVVNKICLHLLVLVVNHLDRSLMQITSLRQRHLFLWLDLPQEVR